MAKKEVAPAVEKELLRQRSDLQITASRLVRRPPSSFAMRRRNSRWSLSLRLHNLALDTLLPLHIDKAIPCP
jgi:hypothetical protein